MGHTKVPAYEAWSKTSRAPVRVRWIDINKGDKNDPAYRRKFAAKGIKRERE